MRNVYGKIQRREREERNLKLFYNLKKKKEFLGLTRHCKGLHSGNQPASDLSDQNFRRGSTCHALGFVRPK